MSTQVNHLNTMMGKQPTSYISSFVVIGPLVPRKQIVKGMLPYILARLPSWSFDPDAVKKLSCSPFMEYYLLHVYELLFHKHYCKKKELEYPQ